MNELYTCNLCGKAFAPDTDKDGIPKGLVFPLKCGGFRCLCKNCVSHRYEDVSDLIDKEEN